MYIYINVSTPKVFRSHCVHIKTDTEPTRHEHELIRGLLVQLFNRDMSSTVSVSPMEFNVDISGLECKETLLVTLSSLRHISKDLDESDISETSIVVYVLHLSLRHMICRLENPQVPIFIPPEAVIVVLERLRTYPLAIEYIDCETHDVVEYLVDNRTVRLPMLISIHQEGPLQWRMDDIMRSLILNLVDHPTAIVLLRYHIRMVTGSIVACSPNAFDYIRRELVCDLEPMILDPELIKTSLRLAIRELMYGNEQE